MNIDAETRTFGLAGGIDEAKVDAMCADGVLSLVLPRKAAASATMTTVR